MKFDQDFIPNNDLLKSIVNRTFFHKLPTTIGVNSQSQSGKSTTVFWYANRLEQIVRYKGNWQKHKDEWDLWDYKKYCTTDLEQLVDLYEESWEKTIVLEEAADQDMSTTDFFSQFSKAYSAIARTQGVHLNRVFLITPCLNDLLNQHKRGITFVMGEFKKLNNMYPPRTQFGWGPVKVKTLSLKPENMTVRWRKPICVKYSNAFLKKSSEYTDWLKLFKKDIMQGVKDDIRKSKKRKADREAWGQDVQLPSETAILRSNH
jgi:hypothetical protein